MEEGEYATVTFLILVATQSTLYHMKHSPIQTHTYTLLAEATMQGATCSS